MPDTTPNMFDGPLPRPQNAPQCECVACGTIHDDDDSIRVDNDPYCPNCAETCDECGASTAIADSDYVDALVNSYRRNTGLTHRMCQNCAHRCPDCEHWFVDELSYTNNMGDAICERCSESYYTCDDCGAIIHSDESEYDEDNDQTLCQECYRNRHQDDDDYDDAPARAPIRRRPVRPGPSVDDGSAIHPWNFKPAARFFVMAGETTRPDTPYFGIEIEAQNTAEYHADDCADHARNVAASGLFYCKEDSSIWGDHDDPGFEVVSHPATWNYWKAFDFAQFEALRKLGYRSYNTDTCGMHVHVSRAALSTAECVKLQLFFKKHPAFIGFISRRNHRNRMGVWAAVKPDPVKTMILKAQNGNVHAERYAALNFENQHTVEIRIFRGTLDRAGILRNLGFVISLVKFAKHARVNQLTLDCFKAYLAEHGLEYLPPEVYDAMMSLIGRYVDKARERRNIPLDIDPVADSTAA